MSPLMMCLLAAAAAGAAALAGWALSPARRARRHREQQLDAVRCLIAGRLAKYPSSWTEFWYDHELDTLDAPGGGA